MLKDMSFREQREGDLDTRRGIFLGTPNDDITRLVANPRSRVDAS